MALLKLTLILECPRLLSSCVLVLLCLLTTSALPVDSLQTCDEGPCHTGEYLDQSLHTCLPCGNQTFMKEDKHRCTDCVPCTQADTALEEVEIQPCTRDQDTVIGCKAGHFLSIEDDLLRATCQKCSECSESQEVVTHCNNDTDTVCRTPHPGNVSNQVTGKPDTELVKGADGMGREGGDVNIGVIISLCVFAIVTVLVVVLLVRRAWHTRGKCLVNTPQKVNLGLRSLTKKRDGEMLVESSDFSVYESDV